MATKAQIDANRENAKKSTGPRTAQGKAAASQNALKHGFFAREAVVKDEDQADFDLYREAMLAEMGPVGVMESTLAERIVALAWRLRRAERMQDQALRLQIDSDWLELRVRQLQWSYRDAKGLPQAESRPRDDHMTLGRAARNDVANYGMLDKLLMYERRIENSMLKMIAELRKLQVARKAEQTGAGEGASPPETTPARDRKSDCAKQSQSAPAQRGANSDLKKDYGKTDHIPAPGNEANQTRFQGATSARMGGGIRCSSNVRGRLALG